MSLLAIATITIIAVGMLGVLGLIAITETNWSWMLALTILGCVVGVIVFSFTAFAIGEGVSRLYEKNPKITFGGKKLAKAKVVKRRDK